MSSSKVLVILSGGQDSTTVLYWAKKKFDEVHSVTFDYGQRHQIEIEAAETISKLAGVASHECINIQGAMKSTSPLLSDNALEKYTSAQQMEAVIGNRRELTFVPLRNMLFLNIAANRAEVMGITNLATGVCQMDNANYPDCRGTFIDAAQQAMNMALGADLGQSPPIVIHTPLMYLSKAETVKLAYELPDCWKALAYSHTSYDGKYPPTDMNHANVLRAQGFEEAGLPDPLVLRAVHEGLMHAPKTANYSAKALKKAEGYVRS